MNRRIMRVEVSAAAIADMFITGKKFQCLKGVPPTATLISVYQNPLPGNPSTFLFFFEDDSFPEITEGMEAPKHPTPICRFTMDREVISP